MFHFFLTGRTVFRTSLFSYVIGPCFEHVSLLGNCTRPGSNNSFFFATERVLFRTSIVWPQFDASGRNPVRELRNSGESAARSDDPSPPFSPRRPLNGGLVSQKRETSHSRDSMHNSSQMKSSGFRKRFTSEMRPISGTDCIIRVKS